MTSTPDLRKLIEEDRQEIITRVKESCAGKDYFQGHSLPPGSFLDVIIKDYLETMIICYETGSMVVFKEKLGWFKEMYGSRRGGSYPGESRGGPGKMAGTPGDLEGMVLDFFLHLERAIVPPGHPAESRLAGFFKEMQEVIKDTLGEGSPDENAGNI